MSDFYWFLLLISVGAFNVAQYYIQNYKVQKTEEQQKLKERIRDLDQKIIASKERILDREREVIRLREKKLEAIEHLRVSLESQCRDLEEMARLKDLDLEKAKKILQYEEEIRAAAEKRAGVLREFLGEEDAPKASDNSPASENTSERQDTAHSAASSTESQPEFASPFSNNLPSPLEFFDHSENFFTPELLKRLMVLLPAAAVLFVFLRFIEQMIAMLALLQSNRNPFIVRINFFSNHIKQVFSRGLCWVFLGDDVWMLNHYWSAVVHSFDDQFTSLERTFGPYFRIFFFSPVFITVYIILILFFQTAFRYTSKHFNLYPFTPKVHRNLSGLTVPVEALILGNVATAIFHLTQYSSHTSKQFRLKDELADLKIENEILRQEAKDAALNEFIIAVQLYHIKLKKLLEYVKHSRREMEFENIQIRRKYLKETKVLNREDLLESIIDLNWKIEDFKKEGLGGFEDILPLQAQLDFFWISTYVDHNPIFLAGGLLCGRIALDNAIKFIYGPNWRPSTIHKLMPYFFPPVLDPRDPDEEALAQGLRGIGITPEAVPTVYPNPGDYFVWNPKRKAFEAGSRWRFAFYSLFWFGRTALNFYLYFHKFVNPLVYSFLNY